MSGGNDKKIPVEVEKGPVCRMALDVLELAKEILERVPVEASEQRELWQRADGLAVFAVETLRGGRPATPAPAERPPVFAWVIERADSGGDAPIYFAGGPDYPWSGPGVHEAAVRFARECDAAAVAAVLQAQTGAAHRVCEHGWHE